MPDEAAEWLQEYRYRHHVVPGLSHDEYLDEPGDAIQWLTRIHGAERAVEAEKAKE